VSASMLYMWISLDGYIAGPKRPAGHPGGHAHPLPPHPLSQARLTLTTRTISRTAQQRFPFSSCPLAGRR
jgi:hypothetical protein